MTDRLARRGSRCAPDGGLAQPRSSSRSWRCHGRLVARRRAAGSSASGDLDRLPAVGRALGGVARRVRRREGRLEPLARPPLGAVVRRADRADHRRRASSTRRGSLGDAVRGDRRARSSTPWIDLDRPRPAGDPRRPATTCWSSACCAGRPASSPPRRSSATAGRSSADRRPRGGPRREHVGDDPRPALASSSCSALAALFLLIRLHALDEQATWMRRRIGDPAAVGSLYLRGGTVFILVAIVGSLALTATAPSAPLAGAWDDAQAGARSTSAQRLQRILPAAPTAAASAASSSARTATIGGTWSTPNEPRARRSSARRATTAATTGGRSPTTSSHCYGWDWTRPDATRRAPAGDDAPRRDRSTRSRRRGTDATITFTVTPRRPLGAVRRSARSTRSSIDRDTTLLDVGRGRLLPGDRDRRRSDPYTVTARSRVSATIAGRR